MIVGVLELVLALGPILVLAVTFTSLKLARQLRIQSKQNVQEQLLSIPKFPLILFPAKPARMTTHEGQQKQYINVNQ